MATFMRTNSSSSISSIGSDNAEAGIKAGKAVQEPGKAKNIVQRTRDALGDIGNRLKKNPGALGGKGLAPANAGVKKANLAATAFAVPANRPPRAAVTKSKGIVKAIDKPQDRAVDKPQSGGLKKQLGGSVTDVPVSKSFRKDATQTDVVDNAKKIQAKTEIAILEDAESDKENLANIKLEAAQADEVDLEGEETENEYDPKLNSVAPVESFTADRMQIVDIDVDESNPLLVQVYIKEIYDYVFALEKKYPIRIRYLEGRSVNSRMRGVLLDWLIEVHTQFGFMAETLYLATKILDRYLQADRNITRKQLQLVGVTAMYLAAKYEEVCTPAVQDFAAVSDNAFTVGDVIKMEQDMLKALSFDLAFPPAVLFLRRFSKAANATMVIHSMAKYIMELSLVDYAACHLFPSEQAAGSLALALIILDQKLLKEVWNPTLQHYTRYSLDDLKPIVSILAGVLARANEENTKLKAVNKKYAGKRLGHTSLAPELKEGTWKGRILKEVCKV